MSEEEKKEKALEQSFFIATLQQAIKRLDIEFLKEAVKDMSETHNHRDSIAILNPRPLMHRAQQDLSWAKIVQLKKYIELAENIELIGRLEVAAGETQEKEGELMKLFGG